MRLSWLWLLLALGGCATMGARTRSEGRWQAVERCRQGPFEIRDRALGTRWGERLRIIVHTPRPLAGMAQARLGGAWEPATQHFAGPWPFQLGGQNDTSDACKPTKADRAPLVTTMATADGPVARAPQPPGAIEAPLEAVGLPLRRVTRIPGASWQSFTLIERQWGIQGIDGPPWAIPNEEIAIRFWFSDNVDLSDVTFQVLHEELRPTVSDERWARHLRERAAADEARRRREAEQSQHRRAQEQPTPEPPSVGVPAPVLARPEPPLPHDPDGPPPPPHPETPPPRPSVHAEWIPGYWQWDGFHYGWLGGLWRVPDSDVAEKLTTQAPAPPPPPRAETREPAVRGTVWLPGYWQWNGAAFVWVRGGWCMPPAGGTDWQPPRWIIDGASVRFIPGRWRRPR